ncbi:hypothetical protein TNCV_3947931 [Trichonephila clavipes]|nr:hypothetical protein TNCV_3947931 [Trichonephila clavipes]
MRLAYLHDRRGWVLKGYAGWGWRATANDNRTSSPLPDEFRGPGSEGVEILEDDMLEKVTQSLLNRLHQFIDDGG